MGAIFGRRCCSAVALGLSVSLALIACGEAQDPSPLAPIPAENDRTPTLTVVLTSGHSDSQQSAARGGNGDTPELWVKIDQICLQGVDDGGQGRSCLLPEDPGKWRNVEEWETLVEGVEVPPGTAQMRFIITQAVIVMADGTAYATSTVDLAADPPPVDPPPAQGLEPVGLLHCPSCGQSGIKVIFPDGEPTMTEGENFLIAAFDVAESIGKERGNSGRWVMHPVIRGSLILKARLTVEVVGEGSVTISPPGVDCPDDCAANYPVDQEVTLTAGAADGWSFIGWAGDCSGSEATTVVLMDRNKSCSATFEASATETSMRGTVSVATNAQFPGTCGGLTVTADSLIKYFRPFISNGESREAVTDPATGTYEITPLTPGTYNLGWISAVPFGNELLAYSQVVVTDPDDNPNDNVTEVVQGQTTIVDYAIAGAFCSD